MESESGELVFRVLVPVDPYSPGSSLGLLEVAGVISGEGRIETYAFCLGEPDPCLDGHFDFCLWTSPVIDPHDTLNAAKCIEGLYDQYNFGAILFPATCWGRNLAPRVAMGIRAGLVADVTAVESGSGVGDGNEETGNTVRLVRPAFDGKLLAVIECMGNDRPIMASIRTDAFKYTGDGDKNTEHIPIILKKLLPSGISLLSVELVPPDPDIRGSDILISGGDGVGDAFDQLAPLAEVLGGSVSASRQLVDKGIAPRSIQVGQSGKMVSPKVYFALGIYGALQHIEGLRDVDCIISVNTNRKAPICSISDVVIEGDALEFVRKLTEKIVSNR